ncbi:hypothetical protein OH76DRAFT_1420072 [Lentinus brumalis]|uniref:Uncharacterized protein n=1 Tax=Lentinus brumalis TaxID=2498619 RepID=A0A371D295_9APHY|nr:hypothetical protein OH76DRAFT_1420072 [Polyporus brumalis]
MAHSLVLTPSSNGTQQAIEGEPMALDWSGTSPESPVASGSPSPTVRAALRRSQATTAGGPGTNAPAPGGTQALQQVPAGTVQNAGNVANVGDNTSDAGTDYFAYFSSPPIYDPPHYLEHTLQGATIVEENWQAAAEAPASHNGVHGPDVPDGDLRALVLGEQQHNPSTLEHSRNPRKRLWTGSPNPEGVQRGLRRARPAHATPSLTSTRRLDETGLEERNPWESARRAQTGIVGDNNVNFLGLAFNPVSASTPSLPARAALSPPQAVRSIPPRDPPAPGARPAYSHAHSTLPNQLSALSLDNAAPPLDSRRGPALTSSGRAPTDTRGAGREDDTQLHGQPRDKGKAKACAQDLHDDDREPGEAEEDGMADDERGGWSEAELREARYRSLRQSMDERAGPRYGGLPPAYSQSFGAGPSGHRDETGHRGEAGPSSDYVQAAARDSTHRPSYYHGAADQSSPAPPRDWDTQMDDITRPPANYNAVPRPHSGPARATQIYAQELRGPGRGARGTLPTRREHSAFAPIPNTRAAQYMAEHAPQSQQVRSPSHQHRSPLSHIASPNYTSPRPTPTRERTRGGAIYGENVAPSPNEERWDSTRDENAMQYEEAERHEEGDLHDFEYDQAGDNWCSEEGDFLPTVLRSDDVGTRLEPTDEPEGGFPAIHRDDPEAGLRGMATDWIREMWSDPPNSVVLVDVFNYRYSEDDAYNRRVEESLRRAFEFISNESGFDVVPPEPEDGARTRARNLPTLWAIRGLTPEGVARALERRTWSFPSISFHTSPRSTPIPRWIMMLEGFLNDNERNIRAAILRVLEEPEMRRWLERMVSSNPDFAGWQADRAVCAVMRTLHIETMQLGNGNYVTNVFIRSPTRDRREWRRWVADLRARRYRSFANGTGRVRYVAACGGCRSVGHPMHLCPFPRVRGWNGPEQGQGVFGERSQSYVPHPPSSDARRLEQSAGRPSNADYSRTGNRNRNRNRDRSRSPTRRRDGSSRSAGPPSRRRDGRGPDSGKGADKGSGKRGF